ncbi:MAG: hypothetical protein CSA96_06880 [Bacteroidetes bacterium]|nr:MAG: hypothetical protein CSA96_06880 [Bacteroidota bacterium]
MRINDEAVKRSMEKMLSNPANARFNINGNNNTVIDGNNNKIEINNYSQPPKTKIKQVDNQYNPDIHVTPEQQFKIKEVVTEIGDMCKGVLNDGKYAYIYARMNKKFKVPRYSLLLQKDFNTTLIPDISDIKLIATGLSGQFFSKCGDFSKLIYNRPQVSGFRNKNREYFSILVDT